MSFLLSIFNIFLNCNIKRGIIVKIGVESYRKRGIMTTKGTDHAMVGKCSVYAVGVYIILYIDMG